MGPDEAVRRINELSEETPEALDGRDTGWDRVLGLHQPEHGFCRECSDGNYTAYQSWPCRTVLALIGELED